MEETVDLTKERSDLHQSQYRKDGVISNYHFMNGIRYIPVIGPEGSRPALVRVFASYTSREVQFEYTKSTSPPLIPPPGNTRTGHVFLGGSLSIPSPGQTGQGDLVFGAWGSYNFICPVDLRKDGRIQFDAYPYISPVDFLGFVPEKNETCDEDFGFYQRAWTSPFFDLRQLTTTRILG